jgi:RNA polymerase sigma factor (sigma-70 family)
MASPEHAVLGYLRSYFARRRGEEAGDGELLRRFADARDGDAFALLLQRHGPMVLGLARRVVGDFQAAEDVFQATFLALARKARAIRRPESLPCWLHGVAFRLALRARRAHRRAGAETQPRRPLPPTPLDELSAREFLAVLDEELHGLPETYRGPLILCCLEGLSQEEAARRLGCSPGSVKGRLERGRARLRLRLEQRGLLLPAVFAGPLLAAGATAAVPPALVRGAVHAAVTGAGASPAAAALTHGAMRLLLLNKLKVAGAALLLAVASGVGLGMAALRPPAAQDAGSRAPNTSPAAAAPAAKPVDLHGDPLPEGAVMRLGTVRRRAVGAQLAVSADGTSIIGVRGGKYVSVWDAASGELRQTRELPGESCDDTVLSRDGQRLLRSTGAERLEVWDVRTGQQVRALSFKGVQRIFPFAFSVDGKYVAAVGHKDDDRLIRAWDLATGQTIFSKDVHSNTLLRSDVLVAFMPDGKHLLASFNWTKDGTYCWDLATGRKVWQNRNLSPSLMVFTPDGKLLS